VTPLARELALVLLALAVAVPRVVASERLLVTVGDVTPTSAVVWARSTAPLSVDVVADGAVDGQTVSPVRGPDLTGRAVVRGLRAATRYRYRVHGGGDVVTGTFVTAPEPADRRPLTFLWSGDLGGGGFCRLVDGGYPIFRAMARHRADFFLFVGDTIYADRPCNRPGTVRGAEFVATTLAEFRARHRYNREDPAAQAFLRTTSVYAIWDDHEVRNDFAGPTDPLMPVGRQAFLDYWPVATAADDPARLYRSVRWGGLAELFILDTRQYRSPNTERDGPDKTMLGAGQRRWLVEAVTASTATWKVIVSSVPLGYPTGRRERRDSWTGATPFGLPDEKGTGFASERDAILGRLRDAGVKNLVVLTADVHHAEIIRHEPTPGFAFHELIAGPLSATHGAPRVLDQTLRPRTVWGRGGVNNFGQVAIDADGLTVRIVDEAGTVLFTHEIAPEP
jgi:alkaline phosphatase D